MLKYILSTAFILFISLIGQSQNQFHLSDEEALLLAYADTLINRMNKDAYFPEERLDSLKTSAEKMNKPFAIGVKEMVLGKFFRKENNIGKALLHYSQAVEQFEQCCASSKLMVNTLLGYNGALATAGLFNFDTTYFNQGIRLVKRAVSIAEEIKDTVSLIDGIDFMGDHFYYSAYQKEEMDSALFYYKQVESILNQYSDPYEKADNALGFANVYRQKEDLE
ncbi:MAG: hypothetical protein AAGK97_09385, partial [Bacteroidota bacterium]